MKIRLDENVARGVAELLRELGHDVLTVPEQGMSGRNDDDIWPVIQAEGRVLITQDKGFADIRRYSPGTHHGVLLLRPDMSRPSAVITFLKDVFLTIAPKDLEGCVAVATSKGIRIRRSPRPAEK